MHSLLRSSLILAGVVAPSTVSGTSQPAPRQPGEIAWAIHYDPKTFDPAKVDEAASELVRYLTGGVLFRLNRQSQEPEPELSDPLRAPLEVILIAISRAAALLFPGGVSPPSAAVDGTV